jgi:hypothetical protein
MRCLRAAGLAWTVTWLAAVALAGGDGMPVADINPSPALPVQLGRPVVLSAADEPAPVHPSITGGTIELASYRIMPRRTIIAAPEGVDPVEVVEPASSPANPAATWGSFARRDTPSLQTSGSFAVDAAPRPVRTETPVPIHSSVEPDRCGSGDCGTCVGCSDCGDCCDVLCCDEAMCWELPVTRCWSRCEYLLWWIRPPQFPVLATTGTVASQGRLDLPGTVVLFGGNTVAYDPFSGGRFTFGWWCDPCQKWGIETSFLFLSEETIRFAADSNQFPILTRPFFNINLGREDVQITAAPGRSTGSLLITAPSRLWSPEINLRCNLCCGCWSRLDFFTGFRYLDLTEDLKILENVVVAPGAVNLPPGVLPGDQAIVLDDFHTRNRFYGGQVGLDWECQWNRWLLNVRSKLALGVTRQTITIDGFQHVTRANGTQQAFVGGLLAVPSNIGTFSRSRFSAVPELGVNIGYQITDSLLAWVGYTIVFWTDVVRPGDQIDRVLDVSQIPNFNVVPPPPAPQRRPLVPFRERTFWAQGMNVGLEYRY